MVECSFTKKVVVGSNPVMANEKIKKLKQIIQPKQVKPILCDLDVKSYLDHPTNVLLL